MHSNSRETWAGCLNKFQLHPFQLSNNKGCAAVQAWRGFLFWPVAADERRCCCSDSNWEFREEPWPRRATTGYMEWCQIDMWLSFTLCHIYACYLSCFRPCKSALDPHQSRGWRWRPWSCWLRLEPPDVLVLQSDNHDAWNRKEWMDGSTLSLLLLKASFFFKRRMHLHLCSICVESISWVSSSKQISVCPKCLLDASYLLSEPYWSYLMTINLPQSLVWLYLWQSLNQTSHNVSVVFTSIWCNLCQIHVHKSLLTFYRLSNEEKGIQPSQTLIRSDFSPTLSGVLENCVHIFGWRVSSCLPARWLEHGGPSQTMQAMGSGQGMCCWTDSIINTPSPNNELLAGTRESC